MAELLVGCSEGRGLFHPELSDSTFLEALTYRSCFFPSSLEALSLGGPSLLRQPPNTPSSPQPTALGPHLNSGHSPLMTPQSIDAL